MRAPLVGGASTPVEDLASAARAVDCSRDDAVDRTASVVNDDTPMDLDDGDDDGRNGDDDDYVVYGDGGVAIPASAIPNDAMDTADVVRVVDGTDAVAAVAAAEATAAVDGEATGPAPAISNVSDGLTPESEATIAIRHVPARA